MAGLLSTLLFSILFGGWFIGRSARFRSPARIATPENHRSKDNMPTMGGIFVIGAVVINTLLWCNLTDAKVWLFLLTIGGFGAIGFWDDWSKIHARKGISARSKFLLQVVVAILVVGTLLVLNEIEPAIYLPFFKHVCWHLGIFFLLWAVFVLIGCSNAVNLTDGLDGLAIGSLIPNFGAFTLIAYLAGHKEFAAHLLIAYAHTQEIAVVGAILIGASLGFLWYNSYPAQIFMGDVGSLALGASLAYIALVCKQEFLLVISGGLFVFETISVIMQVTSYRLFGRRIFRMAPFHHHFELLGWPESRITARFGIISLVLCLLAVMTLKLR
jgi:phospho-N-acetylmuramoyl-pentapeptide-transferase